MGLTCEKVLIRIRNSPLFEFLLLTCNIVHVTVKKYMSTYTWLHVRSARNFLMAAERPGPRH